jgi:hypothetical protein
MANDDASPNKFQDYSSMIPSNECIPLFGLKLIAYYNDEGILAFKLGVDQEVQVPISTTIGILELAKHEIMLANTLGMNRKRRDD